MLSKKNRISNRRLIQKIFDKGRLYKNAYFIFKFLPSNKEVSQFAVVVSKKYAPKATERNNIKRQVYESIRSNLNKIEKNIAALIIIKPETAEKKPDYQELNKGVLDFINQNKL